MFSAYCIIFNHCIHCILVSHTLCLVGVTTNDLEYASVTRPFIPRHGILMVYEEHRLTDGCMSVRPDEIWDQGVFVQSVNLRK